jgi:Fic family protein
MERADFSQDAPGILADLPGNLVAFLPNHLPPELRLSGTLMGQVERARGAIGELAGQARLLDNADLVIEALARREAVLSSRIEGTNTQIGELLLQEALDPPVADDTDLREVLNYLATIRLAQSWLVEGRSMGLPLVKDLHRHLLTGVRGQRSHPGEVRNGAVYIGTKGLGIEAARFVPPPAEQVVPLLEHLLQYVGGEGTYGALIDTALAHYQFETIHPFEDGNGRLGRLLIPLQLFLRGAMDRPLLYLGAFLEAHDEEYRDGLLLVSTQGRWQAWVEFFLEALRASAEDARLRVQRAMDLRDRYEKAVVGVSSSQAALAAIPLVMRQVYVSVRDVERHAVVTYPTARAAIDTLVSIGILVPYARVRGRQLWLAAELLREIYEDAQRVD